MKQFLKGFFVGIGFLLFFIFGLFVTKAFDIFVVQNKISIIRDVEASEVISYDEFVSYPRFSASKFLSTNQDLSEEDRKNIESIFSSVLAEVKKSNICSGGSYSLEPNYAYKDGLAVPSGYRFNAGFDCRFKAAQSDEYKNLLSSLKEITKDDKYISLSIPSIRPVLSDDMLAKTQDKLYNKVLDNADKLSLEYSSKLSKDCKITNVLFDVNGYLNKAMYAETSYDMPIVKQKDHKLKANITFECK